MHRNLLYKKTYPWPELLGKDRFWGERWVSNPRPTDPQTVALTY